MWYSDATHGQPMCPPAALYSGACVQANVWYGDAPPSSRPSRRALRATRTDAAPALTAALYSGACVPATVWYSGACSPSRRRRFRASASPALRGLGPPPCLLLRDDAEARGCHGGGYGRPAAAPPRANSATTCSAAGIPPLRRASRASWPPPPRGCSSASASRASTTACGPRQPSHVSCA